MDKELAGFGWYIKRIDNALASEACRNVQSHNLTMQQSHLLFALSDAENHTRTLKELETIFGCAQSTLAGLVTRLEKKGLVEGFTDPRDRRIKHVRLTERGAEMRQRCHEDILQSEKRMSAGMTADEKQLFLQCLQKVYENLKDDMDEAEHCHNNHHNNEGKE